LRQWFTALGVYLIVPVLSGFLLVLAYPTFNWWGTAWFGLVPLLLVLNTKKPISGFFSAFVCGMSFFTGIYYWILEVAAIQWFHLALIAGFLGIYFGLFGFLFALLRSRVGAPWAFLAAPFAWVGVEFVRSHMGFLAHPWPLLGHSQIFCLPVVQLAALTGAYGISFLIVLINATLAATILPLWPLSTYAHQKPSKHGLVAIAVAAGLLVGLTLIYGLHTLLQPLSGSHIKVAVVQANIAQNKKWDPRYAPKIIQIYSDLTRHIAEEQPALIIWPEAATPRAINVDQKLNREIEQLVQAVDIPILIGSTHHQKIHPKKTGKIKFFNSAFLIEGAKGGKRQRYDKIRLLPFGEYLPNEHILPWKVLGIPDIGSFTPGKEFTVFQSGDYRFATPICWETAFPYIAREFVNNGAQFLVNITNEAWFGKTTAPYQFVAMSAFRAVENRVPMVRCTNTGISCFIDPFGRIVDRITDAEGRDIFIRGILARTITTTNEKTIYTRFGDWFAWLCLVVSAAALLSTFKTRMFETK